MDKLREKYKKLVGKEAPNNMSKVMLEKYIFWYEQVSKQGLKELQQLLKSKPTFISGSNGTFVREYQGKKYEVSINDGDFFYMGIKYKSLSKIAREITGTNWNGKLFFGCK
ncbi:MAG: DUF2924 domain-containing protein [Brevinema sp.]